MFWPRAKQDNFSCTDNFLGKQTLRGHMQLNEDAKTKSAGKAERWSNSNSRTDRIHVKYDWPQMRLASLVDSIRSWHTMEGGEEVPLEEDKVKV